MLRHINCFAQPEWKDITKRKMNDSEHCFCCTKLTTSMVRWGSFHCTIHWFSGLFLTGKLVSKRLRQACICFCFLIYVTKEIFQLLLTEVNIYCAYMMYNVYVRLVYFLPHFCGPPVQPSRPLRCADVCVGTPCTRATHFTTRNLSALYCIRGIRSSTDNMMRLNCRIWNNSMRPIALVWIRLIPAAHQRKISALFCSLMIFTWWKK